jgi:hypothetical protein
MAEELRFFVRTGLYVAVTALVYWFVSYEAAGTVLLVVLALAVVALVGGVALYARSTVGELRPHGPLDALNRLVGFHEPAVDEGGGALAEPPGPIPLASAWPPLAGVAALLVGIGLIFGPWLLLPGIALGALAVWGWLVQFD